VLVHVYRPQPAASCADGDLGFPVTCRNPFADPAVYGDALISAAVRQAVGQLPGDIGVDRRVVPGQAAIELARCARGGEILVLGARYHGRLRRHAAGHVARDCARYADCPVALVPEPSPGALEPPAVGRPVHGAVTR